METTGLHKRIAVPDVVSWGILLLIILGAGYYLYTNRPCAQPVTYSLGTFDTEFGINQTTFLADASEAANLWNQAAGHTVLAYSASGTVPINLIYDSRQQETVLGQTIDEQKATLAADQDQIDTQQAQYNSMEAVIAADKASHKDSATVNSEIDALNQRAQQINAERAALNYRITQLNESVSNFNSQNGADFNEGVYVDEYGKQKIDIYEFQDHTQLVRVLAHEMGHALQLEHNSNPNSIMYPVNTATTIALTAEDKAELTAECSFSLNWFSQYHLLLPASWKW